MNKSKIEEFWKGRTKIADPRVATHYRHDDALGHDFNLIQAEIGNKTNLEILDLGCGTCTLTKLLVPYASQIVGVDQQEDFFKHAQELENTQLIKSNVTDFFVERTFDLILLFGVVNFLDESDEIKLYANIAKMLKPHGKFIMKHACGVREELIIDKFSEQIGEWYHARYPLLKAEEKLLSKHFNTEVVDIYPTALNPWENTHYYAFVSTHK